MVVVVSMTDEVLTKHLAEQGVQHVTSWACPCPAANCGIRVLFGWGHASQQSPTMRTLWIAQNSMLVSTPSVDALAAALTKYGYKPQLYGIWNETMVRAVAEQVVAPDNVESLVKAMLGVLRQSPVALA
jgi:hypothetical protein